MFENKYFTVAAVVSVLLLVAVVSFQYMELQKYGVVEALLNK
ncbi:MAG: hypothetical protein ACI4OV_09490 [Victivallaceae bacterium]